MKYIKNVVLTVTNHEHDDVREKSYKSGKLNVEFELWEGENFPRFGTGGYKAPDGFDYRIPGWYPIWKEAVQAIQEAGYPDKYFDGFERESSDSLADALQKGQTHEEWANRMAANHQEFANFKIKVQHIVTEVLETLPNGWVVFRCTEHDAQAVARDFVPKVGDEVAYKKGVGWQLV